MQIGLLLPGAPPAPLDQQFPDYGVMCANWLQSAGAQDLHFTSFNVYSGEFPTDINTFDGLVILGSPASTYDTLDWIAPLETLIRDASAQQIPMIGICFGHQIIAQALGGRVTKAKQGWGVGVHHYQATPLPDGLTLPNPLALRVSHQDQVIEPPANARVIASSSFCPNAALYYPGVALTFQGHPEFSREYGEALLMLRRGSPINTDIADTGMASYSQAVDNLSLASTCITFLTTTDKR